MGIIKLTETASTTKILVQAAAKIYNSISEAKALKLLNQELFIKVPELLGEYSVAVQVRPHVPFGRKLTFSVANVTSMRARSLADFSDESQAIRKHGSSFDLLVDKIRTQTDKLLLSFEYRLKDARFLKDLVHRDVQRDISESEGDIDEYWLHAQLKHPKVLKSKYGRLDLRDIDLNINVGIHQDLKTAVPNDFIRNLRIIKEWIRTKDRTKKWRLGYQHLRQRPRSFTGREDDILGEIQKLFLPTGFKTFLEVTDPFRYYDSVRGADFYDLPFSTFPKTMRVISRTDLNLDNPAAKGKLIYRKDELKKEITKIIGITKKEKKRHPRKIGKKRERRQVTPSIQVAEKNLSSLKSDISRKLRPMIRKRPEKEVDVTDALENLFLTLEYDFKRARVSFPYSTKFYTPDFTSESLSTAIDVKLCKTPSDEKRIIDEINADIPAYKMHYPNLLFAVYDLGRIRDVLSFTKGIEEATENVFVLVIKH